MKQLQQIKGYGHTDAAHTIPISSIKHEQKQIKHQSLIQKCLKSLVKQKMTGCLINLQRKKNSTQQRSNSSSIINEQKLSHITNFLAGSMGTKSPILSLNPQTHKPQPNFLQPSKHNRHQSTNMSLYNISSTNETVNNHRYSILQQTQMLLSKHNKTKNLLNNTNDDQQIRSANGEISFISAIQHQHQNGENDVIDEEKKKNLNTSPDQKIGKGSNIFKLPKIKNRNSILAFPTTLIKNILKKSVDYNINQQLWRLFLALSQQNKPIKTRRQSFSNQSIQAIQNSNSLTPSPNVNLNSSPSISPNTLSSSIVTQKQIKSSIFKPTIPSTTRQTFILYLSYISKPFRTLIQIVLSFFQIKIPSEITVIFYSNMLQQLKQSNERGWAVIAFLFWDFNHDGYINSNDVFERFREFNCISEEGQQKEKYGQGENQGKYQGSGKKSDNNTHHQSQVTINKELGNTQSKKVKKIRKNSGLQMMGSLQNIENVLKKYKQADDPSLATLTRNLSNTSQQTFSILNPKLYIQSLSLIKKSMSLFHTQMSNLNNILASTPYSQPSLQQLCYPLQPTSISYLQQIILTKPITQIKYKQIQPLFSAGGYKPPTISSLQQQVSNMNNNTNMNMNSKNNENKLQIFNKNLNAVKCTSSYKQCFISTEHNQETRLIRQKIEEYKQLLRKKRLEKNQLLKKKYQAHIKLTKQINYYKVVESTIGIELKEIALLLLGYQDQSQQ